MDNLIAIVDYNKIQSLGTVKEVMDLDQTDRQKKLEHFKGGCSKKIMKMDEAKCPVCDNSKYKVLFCDRNRRDNIDCTGIYVQCCECTLVYLSTRPPWKEIVKFYSVLDSDITANAGKGDVTTLKNQIGKPISKWKQIWQQVRFQLHSWPLEPVLKGSKRLLDLGCGNGIMLYEFSQRGYNVWGIDVSGDAIKACKEIIPSGHFIEGELKETSLPDDFFDYIRIDNALEHIPNPREVICECYRLLKLGGKLLIYVPHGRSFSMRFFKGNSISSWIPFHLQLFTRKSLRRLMENSGFSNINIYSYYPASWLPLSLVQFKNKKNHLKLEYPTWLNLLCYPIGLLSAKFGLAEELVVIGIKK